MTDTKHSQAPWELLTRDTVCTRPDMPLDWLIEDADNVTVAKSAYAHDSETELANARVMVQAPEMYALLKIIYSLYCDYADENFYDAFTNEYIEQICSIIEKVEGTTK